MIMFRGGSGLIEQLSNIAIESCSAGAAFNVFRASKTRQGLQVFVELISHYSEHLVAAKCLVGVI